ncbi:MAG: 50S ribosomal protein L23 [Candidatus Eisenbacteria sp.]|nr:50S ribosomal protein L23 [Candidatus Eisenbacteria bacterium]
MKLENRMMIRRALITEKGSRIRAQGKVGNQYLFEVHPDVNKIQISQAVKAMFEVDVVKVRTMRYLGKLKRLGRFEGRRPRWKKAVVTLKPGQSIDIFDEV